MKIPRISDALNQVDDDLVKDAASAKKVKKNNWLKWCIIAACFVVILVAMLAIIPMLLENNDSAGLQGSEGVQKDNAVIPQDSELGNENNTTVTPPDNGAVGNKDDGSAASSNSGINNDGEAEFQLESYYDFEINSGVFTAYIGGKVIGIEKVGVKLEAVAVTGGWKNKDGEWISTEALNAELYEITGNDIDTIVALKFIDQPEGATTTHYYVMMNPKADLSDFEEYVRDPIVPNNPGDEMGNEMNE